MLMLQGARGIKNETAAAGPVLVRKSGPCCRNKEAPGSRNAMTVDLCYPRAGRPPCRAALLSKVSRSPDHFPRGSAREHVSSTAATARKRGPRAGGMLLRPYSDAKTRGLEPPQGGQDLTFTFLHDAFILSPVYEHI